MADLFPQVALADLLPWRALQARDTAEYNVSAKQPVRQLPDFLYRATFYAIGICQAGSVELVANQDHYVIRPDSLVLLGPDVLRNWQQQSADYGNAALFFTESFLAQHYPHPAALRQFAFLHAHATRVLPLPAAEATRVGRLLEEVRQVLSRPSRHQAAIVRGYVAILLYLVADSDEQRPAMPTTLPRRVALVTRFQQLLAQPAPQRQLVADYARRLCVTSKHLSETVKATTGQTAGEWLAAQGLREARHLLGQTERSITQIADKLGFSDASAFGKFFRRLTGQTPGAYRQQHLSLGECSRS